MARESPSGPSRGGGGSSASRASLAEKILLVTGGEAQKVFFTQKVFTMPVFGIIFFWNKISPKRRNNPISTLLEDLFLVGGDPGVSDGLGSGLGDLGPSTACDALKRWVITLQSHKFRCSFCLRPLEGPLASCFATGDLASSEIPFPLKGGGGWLDTDKSPNHNRKQWYQPSKSSSCIWENEPAISSGPSSAGGGGRNKFEH